MPCAELLCIGTELLLGQILNTNAQFLSSQLAAIGIDCLFQTTVGDNTERIISCLKLALQRSDIVITTGGLGPTSDDLTHESIAALFNVKMELDLSVLEQIESLFKERSIVMVDSNRKQALRPQGATLLQNPVGTAPGIIWELNSHLLQQAEIRNPKNTRYIITFPGVPSEMQMMWNATVKPYLINLFGESTIWSIDLKHYGVGESALAEKYAKLLMSTNPTVAPLAGNGECRLRVTAKGQSQAEARNLAQPVVEYIRAESKHLCYGSDEDMLEKVVGQILKERSLILAVAESCTGGLLSKRLTDIPGASDYIRLNVVTYANEAKHDILQVSESILSNFGAISAECAKSMAYGVRTLVHANIGVSITGIAGPGGGSPDKPVGLVYIGLATANDTVAIKILLPSQLSRDEIRYRSASCALNMVRLAILYPHVLESLL